MDELRYLFITSQVEIVGSAEEVTARDCFSVQTTPELATIGIAAADGHKCARCWNYSPDVGEHAAWHATYPGVCDRCADLTLDGMDMGEVCQN